MREEFERVFRNHQKAQEDPETRANLLDVLEDMTWLLENFCTPGMLISAMSIANYARRLEREEIVAILEKMTPLPVFEFEGVDAETSKMMDSVAHGAVEGVMAGIVEGIKLRGGQS